MIDLHLHLDGSLSENDFIYLAKKQNIDLGDDFPNNIYVPIDCPSLEDYLTRFDLPLKLMQTKEFISYVANSLVKRLAENGYIYAEIRYAPLLHLQNGLTQEEVVEAALDGVNSAIKETGNKIEIGLILCCMRHAEEEVNLETIRAAIKFKDTRVVAVDLAGAEAIHPSPYYKKVFALAKENNIHITIHAGEATGSEEIMLAIDNGAERIGHGVHLCLDEESIKKVKENNICFEFCPTSNLQTKSLKTYQDVPYLGFIKNEIPLTINSDNMTVGNTDVKTEFKHLIDTFNLSQFDVYNLLKNSIDYSFTSKETKQKLLALLNEKIDGYYKELIK